MTFLHRFGDFVVGDRIRASVGRRVRLEVSRALPVAVEAEVESRLGELVDEALRSPAALQLIEEAVTLEVKQQLAALEPDDAELNRIAALRTFLGDGARYSRLLDVQQVKALRTGVAGLTGTSPTGYALRQVYAGLLDAETRGLGRIAGTTYNILGKLLTPSLLDPPDGPVLEIGTLYGLFSPLLVRQLRRIGRDPHLTVLDPLAGVQIQPDLPVSSDPTGTPVSPATLRANLAMAGMREGSDVRVLQGYSTDPVTRSEAADRRYAVIVVDGDHSEAGVESDLWWVQDLLLPGGIVVMDDFGDPMWPGVGTAVGRYLDDGGRLSLLGTVASSAYLRG
jgi:hypothetical protein